MKNPLQLLPLFAVSLSAFPTVVIAQVANPSVPQIGAVLRSVPSDKLTQPSLPVYELSVKWNEKMHSQVLSIPFKNDSDRPLEVFGVQSTRGLFVVEFPSKVAPTKEDVISAVYLAADNTEGDTDLVRVLTDRGVREIVIKLVVEEGVRMDSRRLTWAVGEAALPKNVTISVHGDVTKPISVRTVARNTATISSLGGGRYSVAVTPDSTADVGSFPVIVSFDPQLPGGAMIITCEILRR